MATVHFYGEHYIGFDGATEINWNQPGLYEVSDDKAAQLTTDFPNEFKAAVEGELVKDAEETAPEAPKSDDVAQTEQSVASEPTADQAPAEDDQAVAKKGKKE